MGCEAGASPISRAAAVFNGGECRDDMSRVTNTRGETPRQYLDRIARGSLQQIQDQTAQKLDAVAGGGNAPSATLATNERMMTFDRPKNEYEARNMIIVISNQDPNFKINAKKALPASLDPLGDIFFNSSNEKVVGPFFYNALQLVKSSEIQNFVVNTLNQVISEVSKTKKKPTPDELRDMLQRNMPSKTI